MENPRARLLQAHQPTKKRGWVAPASLIVFRFPNPLPRLLQQWSWAKRISNPFRPYRRGHDHHRQQPSYPSQALR